MVSFLSKLGGYIVKGAAALAGFAPLLETVAPKDAGVIQTVSADLSAMANIVVQVEAGAQAIQAAGGTITGAQKLQMAAALVQPILIQSNLIAGRKIADPALLQKAASEIAQGIVDALQSVHEDQAQNMVIATLKT